MTLKAISGLALGAVFALGLTGCQPAAPAPTQVEKTVVVEHHDPDPKTVVVDHHDDHHDDRDHGDPQRPR